MAAAVVASAAKRKKERVQGTDWDGLRRGQHLVAAGDLRCKLGRCCAKREKKERKGGDANSGGSTGTPPGGDRGLGRPPRPPPLPLFLSGVRFSERRGKKRMRLGFKGGPAAIRFCSAEMNGWPSDEKRWP
jgi:hypothetical protein